MDETKESVVYTQKINSEMQNHPQGKYVVIIKKIRVDEEQKEYVTVSNRKM